MSSFEQEKEKASAAAAERPADKELPEQSEKAPLKPLDFSPVPDERALQLTALKPAGNTGGDKASPFVPALDLVSERTLTYPGQKAESAAKNLYENGELKQAREQALKEGLPLLVDVGASWCAPCRALGRELHANEKELAGKAKVVKLDIDKLNSDPSTLSAADQALVKEQKQILKELGIKPEEITGVPYVKLMALNKDGKPLGESKDMSGFPQGQAEGRAWFNNYLAESSKLKKTMDQNNAPQEKPETKSKEEKPTEVLIKREEGEYKVDQQGRVTSTKSADGSLKREITYNGESLEVATARINDVEFRRTEGNNFHLSRLQGKEQAEDLGNWKGNLTMTRSGLFGIQPEGESQAQYKDAGANLLSEGQLKLREKEGLTANESSAAGDKIQLVQYQDSQKKKAESSEGSAASGSDNGTVPSKTIKLEEGTYERNDAGQVIKSTSADGKTVREFKYEDKDKPDRVTSFTVNGEREFRFVGNNKYSDGSVVKKDGHEISSYSIYEKGQLTGNWSGAIEMSKNGVLTTGDGSKELSHLDASSRALSEEERQKREASGIWPNKLTATLSDGSTLTGRYQGSTLNELIETRMEGGLLVEASKWERKGDTFTNPAFPGEVRKNMTLQADGTLSFTDKEGVLQTRYKDGARALTENGVTRKLDREGRLAELTNEKGDKRSIKWEDGEIAAVTTEHKGGKGDKGKLETILFKGEKSDKQELKVTNDGTIEYKRSNGNLVKEGLTRTTEVDPDGRLLQVSFPSGAKREFTYDGDKLKTIKESFTTGSGGAEKQRSYTRQGTSNVFTLDECGQTGSQAHEGSVKAKERIIENLPDAAGNYQYKNKNQEQTRTARSEDLEKIATGELTLSSDNLQEAKEDLLNAFRSQKMNTERADRFVQDLEKNSSKWGVKEENLVKSLDNIRALLDPELKSPHYSREQLNQLAETALHNIGNPMQIDQGAHPTCNITTVEIFTATRHPEAYTQLVRDVAKTGKWTNAAGETCTPPREALKPGDDEKAYNIDKPSDKLRNISSQLVQMSLINAMYETGRMDKESTVNGQKQVESRRDWNYVMVPSQKVTSNEYHNGQLVQVTRTVGEDRLRNGKGQYVGKEDSGPNLTVEDNINASKMLLKNPMPYIAGPYKLENQPWVYDLPDAQRLIKAKQEGMLPMGVPTIGGAHVQTIHDVGKNAAGDTIILLDNQHGERMDGWVTIPELHRTIKEKVELTPSINRFGKPFPSDTKENSRPSY